MLPALLFLICATYVRDWINPLYRPGRQMRQLTATIAGAVDMHNLIEPGALLHSPPAVARVQAITVVACRNLVYSLSVGLRAV